MLVLVTLLFVVAAIPSSAAQHQPADTATRPELDPKLGSYYINTRSQRATPKPSGSLIKD